jgi:hypothetical protein
MPLTPEQRQAWEREKTARAEQEKQKEELLLKRQAQVEKIDQAINKVQRQERMKKILFIALFVVF